MLFGIVGKCSIWMVNFFNLLFLVGWKVLTTMANEYTTKFYLLGTILILKSLNLSIMLNAHSLY